MTLTAVIVDDESNSVDVLKNLLATYCPNVAVLGEGENAESGRKLIAEHAPDIVFLDIEMPFGNGFDMLDAIDAIVAAQEAGVSDEALAEARELHRRGQMRWDFMSSENSTGFHSPQEAARILAMSIDFAHRAQQSATAALDTLEEDS